MVFYAVKGLMEEKQLNFDAPLISIRRYTPEAISVRGGREKVFKSLHKGSFPPPYKSDIKSGPVRKAGSVPFVWEQTPGNPKCGGGSCTENPKLMLKAPNLPPGRKVDAQKQKQQLSNAKPITQHQFPHASKIETSNKNVISLESSKGSDKQEEKRYSDKDCDESDDIYSDALDSLSHIDSCYANCSLSGLSSSDYLHVKPPRNLPMESEARDFMMDRFLPAAKALTSKAPQYAARKPSPARETIRNWYIVNEKRVLVSDNIRLLAVPQQAPEDDEESEEDEDYGDTGYVSSKACGLIPTFCMKSSLCLLNPIPGMRAQGPMPQSHHRRKPNIYKKDTTIRDSVSELVSEHSQKTVYKCNLTDSIQTHQLNDVDSNPTSESNRLTSWSKSQTSDGSPSSRRPNDDVSSCNQKDAPHSPCHDGSGRTIIPKQCTKTTTDECRKGRNSLRELLKFDCESEKGSCSSSPMVEKILYVDSVQEGNRSMSITSLREIMSPKFRDDISLEGEALRRGADVEPQPNIMKEVDLYLPRHSETVDDKPSSGNMCPGTPSEIVDQKSSSWSCGDIMSAQTEKRENIHSAVHKPLSCSCVNAVSAQADKKEDIHSADCPNDGTGSSRLCNYVKPLEAKDRSGNFAYPIQSLLVPPLPKSPSESWLWRTLPSASSQNQSSSSQCNTQFCQRKQVPKTSAMDPKWEKVVRPSNDHFLIN